MIYRAITLCSVAALLSACHPSPPPSHPDGSTWEPPNFLMVHPGLYRGGRPDDTALDYLRSIGVHTIVDLEIADAIEATNSEIQKEITAAEARGFVVLRFPLSAFSPALSHTFEMRAAGAVSAISNPAAGVIYVHCLHGQDRTGLIVGLERVRTEHWTPARAYAEMLRIGFHPGFLGLREFFVRETGYDDEAWHSVEADAGDL